MNTIGWLMFLIIIGIDLAVYTMISMYMDGTWAELHEDIYDREK
jgi:basic membrane lipoprotein Med (substrate-binding protein (PBP1-ABC) superfamily)